MDATARSIADHGSFIGFDRWQALIIYLPSNTFFLAHASFSYLPFCI